MSTPSGDSGCAVVTGAGGGIGRAVCARLASDGYRIAALDVSRSAAESTAELLGGGAAAYAVDVRDAAAMDEVVASVARTQGSIRCAVACAGVIENVPFLELSEATWDLTIDINLKGTLFLFQAAGRQMVDSGSGGSLVALSSISARGPRPLNAAYAASKAAVINLVQSTALALAPHGIRVNAVCPGVIDTEMTTHLHEERARTAGISVDTSLAEMVAKIPLGFIGTPDMVADAIGFLVSSDARYVTGQTLNVCGGIEMN